jgi:hypothetical protein
MKSKNCGGRGSENQLSNAKLPLFGINCSWVALSPDGLVAVVIELTISMDRWQPNDEPQSMTAIREVCSWNATP